jgi:leucyl/phenylalanyl-tRNA---protein transferase
VVWTGGVLATLALAGAACGIAIAEQDHIKFRRANARQGIRQKRPMASRDDIVIEITPQVLLKAYACGIFPMAESADDPALYWIEPQHRGVLLLDQVHIPRRLARSMRQRVYDIRINTDFEAVIDGCAASRPGRHTTWINPKIRALYRDLFTSGYCHTVEAWSGDELVGGLYGVALNGAFFGESMFSTARDASKIALTYLCARLIHGGFSLLDTQFVTEHLKQFGTIEIDRADFHKMLERALAHEADFLLLPESASPEHILQIIRC